jgi:hypothetical protein
MSGQRGRLHRPLIFSGPGVEATSLLRPSPHDFLRARSAVGRLPMELRAVETVRARGNARTLAVDGRIGCHDPPQSSGGLPGRYGWSGRASMPLLRSAKISTTWSRSCQYVRSR